MHSNNESKLFSYFNKRYNVDQNYYDTFVKSFLIMGLFWVSVLFVYTFPIGLDKLFFALLLLIFWFSKIDYFWFAFFIIISMYPGSFFTENSGDALRRLPLYTIIPKASFSVFDVFMIVSFFKALVKGRKLKFKDVLNIKYASIFIVYLIIVSFFHGLSVKTFISMPLRGLFFYTFFFSFPALVFTKRDTYKFMYMFLPFVFNEVFSQMYLLSTGNNLVNMFYSNASPGVVYDKLMGDNIRAIANGYTIIVLSFMFSLSLLENSEVSSKTYLVVVIIGTIISIMLSATRQTIIMFAFMFVLYFVFVNKAKPGILVQLLIATIVLFFIIDILNVFNLKNILNASLNRLTGAVEIKGGSIEAEDTLDYRLTVRLPMILESIKGSLFLGYGFSDEFFKVYDGHLGGLFVGIMQMGIIGYSSLILYIGSIYKTAIYYAKRFGESNTCSNVIKSLLIGVSGYFLVNTFIDPVIIFNVWAKPHEFFILIVLISQFIKFGKMEHIYKRRVLYELNARNRVISNNVN